LFFNFFLFLLFFALFIAFLSKQSIESIGANLIRFLSELSRERDEFEYFVLQWCNLIICVDFALNHIVLVAIAKDLMHGIYELLLLLVPSLDLNLIVWEVRYH
jgi:hypothetical protein